MSKRELDVITLRGLSAVGSHGVHEFERSGSQVFSADIKLYVDVAKAAKTDQVEYTVDYSAMAEDAVKILTGPPVYLIETLANQLAEMALAYRRVQKVEVTVHKPMAPVRHHFTDVSVTVRRRKGAQQPDFVGTTTRVARPAKKGTPEPESTAVLEPVVAQVKFPSRQSIHATEYQGEKPEAVKPKADGPEEVAPAVVAPEVAAPADLAPEVAAIHSAAHSAAHSTANSSGHSSGHTFASRGAVRIGSRMDRHAKRSVPTPLPSHGVRGPKFSPLKLNRSFDEGHHVYQVVIALGSNQGDVLANLSGAVEALAELPGFQIEEVSPLVRTEPVLEPGALPQSDFYNVVLLGRTVIAPPMLLMETQHIERRFGRMTGRRWAPRTLDIDIIMIDRIRVSSKKLQLPHPRAHERAFVLYPWSLVDPDAELIDGTSVTDALAVAPDKAGVLSVQEDWLGSTAPLGKEARQVELAPRAAKHQATVVRDTAPAVEVRGETLHLAPIDGDPIFQKLLGAELAEAAPKKPSTPQHAAPKEPSGPSEPSGPGEPSEAVEPKTAPVPAPSTAKAEADTTPTESQRPKVSSAQRIGSRIPVTGKPRGKRRAAKPVAPPGAPERRAVAEPAATATEESVPVSPASVPAASTPVPPASAPSLELPDWRATITPTPTRVIDDGGKGANNPPTPSAGVSRQPRPSVSRRVTIRPTPSGKIPVSRRGDR